MNATGVHPVLYGALVWLVFGLVIAAVLVPRWAYWLPRWFPAAFLPTPTRSDRRLDRECQELRQTIEAAAWAAELTSAQHTSLLTMLDHWVGQYRAGVVSLQSAKTEGLAWVERRRLELTPRSTSRRVINRGAA